jgi:tetratricopeptide (TPR) repeat protein
VKRLAAILVVAVLAGTVQAAPEKWFEAYARGVKAVNAKNYAAGAEALQKAIAEMPNEGIGVRAGNSLITYVPHFWLGIAKFNLGDVDGALREWRTAEEQGVIARTDYYSGMKDWLARAQVEKQRKAESAAKGPKTAADAAISRALATQVDALSAGGDRTETYRAALRKLQEALAQFNNAGTNVDAFKAAAETAGQATALFTRSADEAKALKIARANAPKPKPPVVVQQQIVPPVQKPVEVVVPFPEPVQTHTVAPPPPAEPEVESEASVAARLKEAEKLRERIERPKVEPAVVPVPNASLQTAYRAFAAGDLNLSEQLLTKLVTEAPTAEAFLLRGCARYTRAMLSRTPDVLRADAAADFREAVRRNRALRLDSRMFSPKLVAFFEDVRKSVR